MRYGVLGPVGLLVDGTPVNVGRPRERRALAALLLDANRVVSTDRLTSVLWDEDPPPTAGAQIRNVIAALRQKLAAAVGRVAPIRRVGGGFLIEVGEGELDLHLFEAHRDRARRLSEASRLAEAASELRDGLDLWRGPALGDVADSVLDAEACRLEEQRLACVEQRIELDLALGRQRDLVGELGVLVSAYPLRERLVELNMTALYLCGRRQDALDAFTHARTYLNEQAGLDPRPELTGIQQAILRGDPLPVPARSFGTGTTRQRVVAASRARPGAHREAPGDSEAEQFAPPLEWEAERLRMENMVLRAELNRIRAAAGGAA